MSNRTHILGGTAFVFWTALIFIGYGSNFSPPGSDENFVLDEILISIALIFISLLSGNQVFKLFRLKDLSLLEEALYSAGIGLGLLSTSIFILGLLQLLYPQSVATLLIIFGLISATNYEYARKLWLKIRSFHFHFSLLELFIILFIFGFVLVTLMNTMTPPVSRDGLIHHLAIPKWYIKHHGIVDIPFSVPSYYPPFMEMLYAGALLLSSDILAKLFHFLYYIGSLLFTFSLGNRVAPRSASLLAVLLFGSLPVVCQVSSIAYADLGLTFFTLGGFLALLQWFQTKQKGWFYLGALMTGWAVGCKYNGIIIFFSFLMGVILIFNRWKLPLKSMVKGILLFLFLIFIVNFLWLVRNYWFTGNPVYPLASSFIGRPWLPGQTKFSQYQIRTMLYGETFWDQILLPWNLSTKTKSKARHELDGVINPIFLVFLPVFLFLPGKSRGIKGIAFFCLLYFLFFWASSRIRLRYLMPIYPMLGIITAYTIANWKTERGRILAGLIVILSLLLNFYWVLVYTSKINPLNFLVGKESRRAFLCRHIPPYPVFEYINKYLPQNARIMFLYGGKYGNDGYYLDRDYFYDTRYMGYTGREILMKVDSPEGVRKEFHHLGISHFLINWNRLQMDYSSSLSTEKQLLFKKFCQKFLRLEFKHGGSFLYLLL
jgi:4-amino-4-deoxy-L-arabinose transferase-like glycosyltransferase